MVEPEGGAAEWLADKQVTVLMQGALKNEPELGNLPNALDFIKNDADRKVMELHFTQKTAARPLVAPPEVPSERVAMLRKAFEVLAQDKEFLAEMDKAKWSSVSCPARRSTRSWRRSPRRRGDRRAIRQGVCAGAEVTTLKKSPSLSQNRQETVAVLGREWKLSEI